MHRSTVVALVAAAVLGISGGSLVALGRPAPDRVSGSPSPRLSPTPAATSSGPPSAAPSPAPSSGPATAQPSASGGGAGPGDLLYADRRKIYDGARTVSYTTPFGLPDRLVRTAQGYLISRPASMEDGSALLLYAVSADGRTRKVADVVDGWDLDPGGTRVVGTDAGSGRLRVWDLTGRVLATASRPVPRASPLTVVWSGGSVLVSGRTEQQQTPIWPVWRWDPRTGRPDPTDLVGMTDWSGSADGTLIAGYVGFEGIPTDESNVCVQVRSAPDAPQAEWRTCDWRLNAPWAAFSPGGTRLLAIPAESDGFGPTQFATFSATRGPAAGVARIKAPALTVDGQWLDDGHVVLRSRTDDELDEDTGTVLHRCDLAGACQVVVRRARGELVLGEQY